MSLLRFFLSYNRIPLILFALFGFFFNLFYNTNILGIKDNIRLVKKLEPFDRHGHVSESWFHNTMTLVNCFLGVWMACFHTMSICSILFNAKYRVVSVLVHMLRIRNLICPIISIFCELILFHRKHGSNMNTLQSKIIHQSNAQLVPTIIYGLAAIMLYTTYDRYLMEIRLIFDYLTLSLRCTRGLSPLEEQTYICEAINLHACRETLVLEQKEKAERDLREMLRREQERIKRERAERSRADEQRLSRVKYVNRFVPALIYLLRTVFGLQRMCVNEDNIPPSIRTGIEKQKDELRICAAKTMCCNIQKHFKDKGSILPNCFQGISRAKINLCELKDKDLCTRDACGKNRAQSPAQSKCLNMNSFRNTQEAAQVKREEAQPSAVANCLAECKRGITDKRQQADMNAKKKDLDRERKEQEKCEREMKARQKALQKEEEKRRKKIEDELDEDDAAVSIFNDLPRTELVMNCEIKRVLDPDCQEVLRCKEVIVPPPLCDKGKGARGRPTGPRAGGISPVGMPFGTASNCNNPGMAQRLSPIYQCVNLCTGSTSDTCNTGATGSYSTTTNRSCTPRGRQMDGLAKSFSPQTSATNCCTGRSQSQDMSCLQGSSQSFNSCAATNPKCEQRSNSCGSISRNSYGGGRSMQANKSSVQAIPVQVTLRDNNCTNDAMRNLSQDLYKRQLVTNNPLVTTRNQQDDFTRQMMNSTLCSAGGGGSRRGDQWNTSHTLNTAMRQSFNEDKCCTNQSQRGNSFSNAGAAKPIEAQKMTVDCDYCPVVLPDGSQQSRAMAVKLHPCTKCMNIKCDQRSAKEELDSAMISNRSSCCSADMSGTLPRNVRQSDIICQLRGGAEEPPKDAEPSPPTLEEKNTPESMTVACTQEQKQPGSPSGNNKLTETKREVFKTVTNIDDPSGKMIRKECDTTIEEILQSSNVPGETKTTREVTVQKNIIQEANKTIREERHNTREEIINFELDNNDQPVGSEMSNEFDNRQRRLNLMRRISKARNDDRLVSEEKCIYGKCKESPDANDLQSEADVRSRACGPGLKGGAEKRGQSEAGKRVGGDVAKEPSRSQSTGSHTERYYAKGDFCRDFNAHLENSPYGERIRQLKSKLVDLSTPEEIHKTLEKIVLLETDALMSFVPRDRKLAALSEKRQFDPDLSYSALMQELKSVLKKNDNMATVAKTIDDIDSINVEIEREMKRKPDSQSYYKRNRDIPYPNHYAFAALIRELRHKIKNYEDGHVSPSDDEVETEEQRRQRIEVLRDELEKRKQMLGLTSRSASPINSHMSANDSASTIDRIRQMKDKVASRQKDLEKQNAQMQRKAMPKNVTIREPASKPTMKGRSQSARTPIPKGYVLQDEATIYMDPNGVISKTSVEADELSDSKLGTDFSESGHSIPSPQELQKCFKEACKKKCKKSSKRPENQQKDGPPPNNMVQKTNVKQLAQSLAHVMEMMSKAKMTRRPQISMKTELRKTNLSQDSDVTAVEAQAEAAVASSRKKCDVVPHGLLGGASAKASLAKTPSRGKLHRSKVKGTKSIENLSANCGPIQITYRLQPESSTRNNASTAGPMKVDKATNDMICQYLRGLGQLPKAQPGPQARQASKLKQ